MSKLRRLKGYGGMEKKNPQAQLLAYTIVQRFWVSYIFFFKEINSFIQQGCIKLIKCDSKDICSLTKDFYTAVYFNFYIHQTIL